MPLPSYPAPPGNKNISIAVIAGPTSYTQVTTGTPPTGGQVILPSAFGLVAFEYAESTASDDGQYNVTVIFDRQPNRDVPQIRLLWTVAATGAQVSGATNLSARSVRMLAYGL